MDSEFHLMVGLILVIVAAFAESSGMDEVLDSPMNDYAILDGAYNANLTLTSGGNAAALSTQKIPTSGKYYIEFTSEVNVNGDLFARTSQ